MNFSRISDYMDYIEKLVKWMEIVVLIEIIKSIILRVWATSWKHKKVLFLKSVCIEIYFNSAII